MSQIDTAVAAVTVYPDRARVTRRGAGDLDEGLHVLEVHDLPITLNPDSLRASARGTARARLFGVQIQRSFFAETPAEQVRALEEAIEASQDSIGLLEARLDLIKKNRAYLEDLAGQSQIFATALAAGETGLEDQLALLDGLRARGEALAEEENAAAGEKRRQERTLQKLKNELNQQRGGRPRQRYTALVEVEILEPGELTLELAYVLPEVNWQPLYDLRLIEDDGQTQLEVGYLAQVIQRSGENWDEVSLTISTARPALSGRLPDPEPWYIAPFEPVEPFPVRPRAAMLSVKDARGGPDIEAQAAAEPVYEAEEVGASIEQAGGAVAYRVPGQVSIPSDGAPHKVTVAHFNLPPRLDYVAAPRLIQAVYRRARVVNDSPYVFLPGQVNLFAGDEFLGSASLDLTPPQGEMELYLGVEDRLKVERELKRREVDKSLVGGKRRLHYAYEIELENLLPLAASLTLHDQLPVSRHEDIKVKLDSADPRPGEHTSLNLLTWEFSLSPAEKRTVSYGFSVEHPQSMKVAGLP
jgi:uncharacterized protein (TIGR02231 family)